TAERAPELVAAGAFDLILLDNRMPGMSGIQFLETLRQNGTPATVILMTGAHDDRTAIQATKLGAFDYVIKPDDYDDFLAELGPPIEEAGKITRPTPEVRLQASRPAEAPATILGRSKPMLDVFKRIGLFAAGDDAVLILGETGTGKELVARAIHTN